MFTQRLHRSLGLSAHLGWARLMIDRFQDLVLIPTPTNQGSGRHHHLNTDDEDAFEYENHHNPDTPSHHY